MSRKVVITGVPGVGKTTVIEKALEIVGEEGITYKPINFGTFMFEVAESEGLVKDRDEMRKLEKDVQKRLQKTAAQALGKMEGNILIDTHSSVKTPVGFLAGLPEWVLKELMPDNLVLVETDADQILMRRLSDESRVRDMEGSVDIDTHQRYNRAIAAAYSMYTGCVVSIVKNPDDLLEKSAGKLADVLR